MKNVMLATIALAAVAGSALAQSWSVTGTANNAAATATITSATTLKAVPIQKPTNKVWVFLKSGGSEGVDVQFTDNAGNILQTSTVTATTTFTSVTVPAPQFASRVKVSPTALTGSDSVTARIVQAKELE